MPPSIQQPRAAGAPPETASSLHQSCSPAQRELPEKQAPPSINPAAPRSGNSLRNRLLPPSINPAAPRSGGSSRNRLLPLSMGQPRAAREIPTNQPLLSINPAALRSAGNPHESASSLHQSCSPAQQGLYQKQASSSLHRAAPRSGKSPRSSLFSPSIEQPRAAGETDTSLPCTVSRLYEYGVKPVNYLLGSDWI